MKWVDSLVFNNQGLVAAIAQDIDTGAVLMLAWMNQQAIEKTLDTGNAHFWSRSRKCLWQKGETSGNTLLVKDLRLDCDGDALLLQVQPQGPVCHTGETSCFYRKVGSEGDLMPAPKKASSPLRILADLGTVIHNRRNAAEDASYTARLLAGDIERIAKKVGEEAFETALAAATQSDKRLAEETADLLYHVLILLEARGLTLDDACMVLASRRRGWSNVEGG